MFPIKALYLLAQHPLCLLGVRETGTTAAFLELWYFLQPLLSWVLNLTCPQSPNISKTNFFLQEFPALQILLSSKQVFLHPDIVQLLGIISSHDQAPSGYPQQDCVAYRHRLSSCSSCLCCLRWYRRLGTSSCTSLLLRKPPSSEGGDGDTAPTLWTTSLQETALTHTQLSSQGAADALTMFLGVLPQTLP